MSEGNVYLCEWDTSSCGFNARIPGVSSIEFSAKTLDELKDVICDYLLNECGDGEAILEFLPEINAELELGTHLYNILSYLENNKVLNRNELYTESWCDTCKYSSGVRTDSKIELKYKPSGAIVAVKGTLPIIFIYHITLVKFLEELVGVEFDKQPVLHNSKESDYFELFCDNEIRQSGVFGATYPTSFSQSWKCSLCGQKSFTTEIEGVESGVTFLAPAALQSNCPKVIFIQKGKGTFLALRKDVWSNAARSKSLKKISTSPVYVLKSDLAEDPDLPITSSFDWIL